MLKKISIACGTFFALSLLAPAQTDPAAPSPASVLGALEATVSFCAKVNPEAADKYKKIGELFTNGQDDDAVAEIRNSKEYKDSLDQTNKQLGALSAKEATAACKLDPVEAKSEPAGKK